MNWTTFIIPAIVGVMALVLLRLVDDKRRKTGRSRVSATMYALAFGATFAFTWGISYMQKSSGGGGAVDETPIITNPSSDVTIDRMIEMTDKSAKAPF